MISFFRKNHLTVFFICWFLLGIIQAAGTELFDDEAYYWVYSQFPAWGYFDHPPMIAWLIKAGGIFFNGEAGIRFFIVVLNTATLYIIYRLLRTKDDALFYLISFSFAVAQIGGMIAVPDLPLLFFVALFFYIYRDFVESPRLLNAVLLGCTVSLMMYSKYHGLIIVLSTLLSNPSLFRRPHTYLVAGISLLLYAPHLYWQYTHDFPSVRYHLFERNARHYQFLFTAEYLMGQLLVAGPIIGWLFLWASFRFRPITITERALKYTMVGTYLLFLVSTLKGRVEANWTTPAFVSLIILSHQYLVDKPKLRRIVVTTLPITLVFVLAGRIYMLMDIEPLKFIKKDEFHQNIVWTREIRDSANGANVVFLSSYQRASKYWFYTGDTAFSLNNPSYRRNNYNYLPLEDSIFNEPAFVVAGWDSSVFNVPFQSSAIRQSGGARVKNYFSFSRIRVEDMEIDQKSKQIAFTVITPANYLPYMQQSPMDTATIYLAIVAELKPVLYYSTGIQVSDIKAQQCRFMVPIPATLPPGRYPAKMVISSCLSGQPSLNSTGIYLEFGVGSRK